MANINSRLNKAKIDNAALQRWVEAISNTYFNVPFTHQATFNKRLRTTGGRYHTKTHNLDFNPKVLMELGEDIFEGVIKHELCHYHLHLAGRGFEHKDRDFKLLLKQVGGLRFTPTLKSEQAKSKKWHYQCQGCGVHITRKRRFNTDKYICRRCQSKFKLMN